VYERVKERRANRIPGIKLGKYWRFRLSNLREWLERQLKG
jgi:hypothetical protein